MEWKFERTAPRKVKTDEDVLWVKRSPSLLPTQSVVLDRRSPSKEIHPLAQEDRSMKKKISHEGHNPVHLYLEGSSIGACFCVNMHWLMLLETFWENKKINRNTK